MFELFPFLQVARAQCSRAELLALECCQSLATGRLKRIASRCGLQLSQQLQFIEAPICVSMFTFMPAIAGMLSSICSFEWLGACIERIALRRVRAAGARWPLVFCNACTPYSRHRRISTFSHWSPRMLSSNI